ncbi:MAG TPA: OmpA family protein [Chitinophagales bacterium]|nr:OmpA family protein [Chitinophagales bacterium]
MKKIFTILAIIMTAARVFAQPLDPEVEKMNYTRKIMYGDALMSSGSYYNAQDVYKLAYDDDATEEAAYKLGRAYYLARNYKDAEKWYKTAMDNGKGAKSAFPEAGYYYAMSLKYNGKYPEAKEAFKAVSKNSALKGTLGTQLKRSAKNEDKGCDLAIELGKKPADVNVEHLGANVNNNYTDFSPRYNPDNNLTYASLVSEEVIDMGSQKKTELRARIFTSNADGDTWSKATELKAPFNKGDAHTGNGSYSLDGKRFYYTECSPNDSLVMVCKIYVSEWEAGEWSNGKEVPNVNESGFNATHPAIGLFKGKEYLYFSSNRTGGRGGADIWYAEVKNKGKDYSNPMNCGTKINTTGDEITPFYNEAQDMFYFSSNGQINIGGFDIYKAKGGAKTFEQPQNLGLPFNSSVDDFGFSTDITGKKGFFVSNRKGGFSVKSETCCDDIYAYKYPPEFVLMARAIDMNTKEVIFGAAVDLNQSGVKRDSSVTKTSATYEDFYVGTAQDKFEIVTYKDKYKNGIATTSTVGLKESDTLYIDVLMEPIIEMKPIEVKNIYYPLGKWDLRPESFKALDSLYNILALSPQLKVEVGSHTDSRDDTESNRILAQHRADTVVSYLISRGISADRLVATGYGESTPKTLTTDVKLPSEGVVPAGTVLTEAFINKYKGQDYEFLHQINRRTEFTIIGIIPNAIITYDEATIEANEARLREEENKRNQRLQDLQQVDESDTPIDNGTETPKTNTNTNTGNKGKTTTPATTGAVTLDPAMTKKGNMFEGNAAVNGAGQTKYILNLSPTLTVAMVGKDYFITLWNAGLVTEADIKNDKPTDLGNGTVVKGDVFTIKTLQLGEITLTNVDTKINLNSTQNLVVGVKVVEKGGCEFDQAKIKFKCK